MAEETDGRWMGHTQPEARDLSGLSLQSRASTLSSPAVTAISNVHLNLSTHSAAVSQAPGPKRTQVLFGCPEGAGINGKRPLRLGRDVS